MLDAPRTKEAAAKYRYRRWGGNPAGTKYDPERCAYEVWEKGRGCLSYQCLRKKGYGPDGLYCKVHARKFKEP